MHLLSNIVQELKNLDRLQKIEKLRQILADPERKLNNFESIPLLLDPEVHVTGIVAGWKDFSFLFQ